MNDDSPLLFALKTTRTYGEAVAARLGIALALHEEREFEDGEHKARPLVNVRGRDVYVLHSLYGEHGASANDKLCRLLFFIGALKDAAARQVTAIVPYLAYARKDRRSQPRDPVTTRYVASLFEAVGTDCVLTIDVHNQAAFENAFRCRTEELEARSLFAEFFAPMLEEAGVAIVSPDAGGMKRADRFRVRMESLLRRQVGIVYAEKHRGAGVVRGDALVGNVAGKTCIVIDDLISAGTTMARAAQSCQAHGAARILAAATHGAFAVEANAILSASPIERIAITDTVVPLRATDPAFKAKLAVVSTAGLIAEAIRRLHAGGSIVELKGDAAPTRP